MNYLVDIHLDIKNIYHRFHLVQQLKKEFYHIYLPWGRIPEEISENTIKIRNKLVDIGTELLKWINNNTPDKISQNFSMPLNDMIKVMNNGGKIAILGIAPTSFEVNWNEIIFKMLEIKGIYGREMYETWYKMIALVQSGLNIENIITHKFHFTDFEKAFKIMEEGNCGKIILNWS